MDAIDDQQAAILRRATAIRALYDVGDGGDWNLYSGRGMNPRYADCSSPGSDGFRDSLHDIGSIRFFCAIVELDVANVTTRTGCGKTNRFVMRVVIVLGG